VDGVIAEPTGFARVVARAVLPHVDLLPAAHGPDPLRRLLNEVRDA
jgi:hypothetical protein